LNVLSDSTTPHYVPSRRNIDIHSHIDVHSYVDIAPGPYIRPFRAIGVSHDLRCTSTDSRPNAAHRVFTLSRRICRYIGSDALGLNSGMFLSLVEEG